MDESDQITRWPSIDAGLQWTIPLVVSSQQEDVSNCRLRLSPALLSVNSPFEDTLITTSHRVKLIKRIASFRARLQIVGSEISMEKKRARLRILVCSCIYANFAKCYEVHGGQTELKIVFHGCSRLNCNFVHNRRNVVAARFLAH